MFLCSVDLWNGEGEQASLTLFAFDAHLSSVGLYDLFDNGQAQAGAAEPSRSGAVHLVESVKNL